MRLQQITTHTPSQQKSGALVVELATSREDILASQRLRYEIFVLEMGATIRSAEEKIDRDFYDDSCRHLIVRDEYSGAVVASTRILTDTQAEIVGNFYSENEFELSDLLPLSGRVMEIGRTCVHADYRNGAAISMLWSGLSRFMTLHCFDYLIGCASVGMDDGGSNIHAIMDRLRSNYFSIEDRRVTPRRPIPRMIDAKGEMRLPPLLKAYLRLGAKVCGEPCWDPDFNTADVFILLDMDELKPRYHRRFISRHEVPFTLPATAVNAG